MKGDHHLQVWDGGKPSIAIVVRYTGMAGSTGINQAIGMTGPHVGALKESLGCNEESE